FALSLVGYRGYGKDLFGRAADLVKLVFDLDMANHFSANLAEPGQAIGNPDESILIHRSNVARVIPATTENLSSLFRTLQISLHDIWAAHQQQSGLAFGCGIKGFRVHNPYTDSGQRMADAGTLGANLAELRCPEVARVNRDGRRAFRAPVTFQWSIGARSLLSMMSRIERNE